MTATERANRAKYDIRPSEALTKSLREVLETPGIKTAKTKRMTATEFAACLTLKVRVLDATTARSTSAAA